MTPHTPACWAAAESDIKCLRDSYEEQHRAQ